MVRSCSLKNCSNSVKQKYRFFVLPSVKKVAKRTAWLRKCGHLLPENLPISGNSISLCEGHFEPDQFVEYGPNIRTILKPTAVPTIFTRNPPRVCDAVALKYKNVLEKNVIDPVDTIPHDISSTNTVENSHMMDISDNDDNHFSNTTQKSDAVFPSIVDPNLSQVEKELLTLSDSITPDENESTVKLLRIKKNCMLVATPVGNKIVPAGEQQIANQPSPPVDHPVLSIDYDNTITTDINVHPPFSIDSSEESTLEILPEVPEPLEQVIINSESCVESQLPETIISPDELSSSPNAKVFIVDNSEKQIKLEFPISEQENLEPRKVNVPKIILVKKPHELNKIQVMTKISKKPVSLKLTTISSPQKSPNNSVIEEKQDDNRTPKKDNKRKDEALEQIFTDSPEAQSDYEPVKFYPSTEKNIEEHETSVNSNNSDQDNVTDDLRILIKQTVKPLNDDVTSVFFPPTNNDPNFLKKRIHELENERDYAIRKYRRLAMKMEIFYKNMRLFLTDDQIRSLETDPSLVNTVHWSLETLQRSAKIRSIIGPRGYEYLRNKEHFPLPSFRTLYRHKDISKLNEYTDEMIRDHMNNTINEVASLETENLNSPDDDIEIEKEILPEHIKIEVLEDEQDDTTGTVEEIEQFNSMSEETDKFKDATDIEVVEYVTVNASKDKRNSTL